MKSMDWLIELYNKLLVTRGQTDFFSPQTLIANLYIIALLVSMYKASKKRELFTNFIAITSVCVQYMLCAFVMEIAISYATKGGNLAIAQNAYLLLVIIAVAAFWISFKAHERWAFVYGNLFIVTNKLIAFLCIGHGLLWLKLAVLKIHNDFQWFHYFYSSFVLFISFALAFVMLFPSVLNTKLGRIMSLSFK